LFSKFVIFPNDFFELGFVPHIQGGDFDQKVQITIGELKSRIFVIGHGRSLIIGTRLSEGLD